MHIKISATVLTSEESFPVHHYTFPSKDAYWYVTRQVLQNDGFNNYNRN